MQQKDGLDYNGLIRYLPDEWTEECIPYDPFGLNNDELTIGQIKRVIDKTL